MSITTLEKLLETNARLARQRTKNKNSKIFLILLASRPMTVNKKLNEHLLRLVPVPPVSANSTDNWKEKRNPVV